MVNNKKKSLKYVCSLACMLSLIKCKIFIRSIVVHSDENQKSLELYNLGVHDGPRRVHDDDDDAEGILR